MADTASLAVSGASLPFSTASPMPLPTTLSTKAPEALLPDDVSSLPNVFAPEASSGFPTLWGRASETRPFDLITAQVTVNPTKALSLADIVAELEAQGVKVDADSQVIVHRPQETGPKPTASCTTAARISFSPPETMTLKHLPRFIREIAAWETMKLITIKVGQQLKPVIIRWLTRRQIRRILSHRV